MAKDRFEFARIASAEEVAEYLTSLAVGLKRGEISLESGEQRLHLTPPQEVKVELAAKDRDEKGRLRIQLGWKPRSAPRAAELRVGVSAPRDRH
jgi:amphi-Trp domain-containing protein